MAQRQRLFLFWRRLGHPDEQDEVGHQAQNRDSHSYDKRRSNEHWRDPEVFGQAARDPKYPLLPALDEPSLHYSPSHEVCARRGAWLAIENGHPFRRMYDYDGYYPRTF